MNKVRVHLEDRSYSIHIQKGLIEQVGQFLTGNLSAKNIFIVTDEHVASLYGQTVLKSIKNAGFHADMHAIPIGEASKSLNIADLLYTKMIQFHLTRDGIVLALGGGVVGDLAGFVASTYLRGIPFIQIPTTLLSQVDSSVGGKVGINHLLGKNLIGSFYQPKLVLIDPDTLKTLDKREIWSGMAEVIKYGLIADSALFHLIEDNLTEMSNLLDDNRMINILSNCCRIKADIVAKDERESHHRRILNFGHTLGHALEALGNFHHFKHGEAIVYGMLWATWLSHQRGLLSERKALQISALLKRLPVPSIPKSIQSNNLMEKMQLDKKQSSDGLNLILLKDIGKVKIEKLTLQKWMIDRWWGHVHA